VDNNPPVRAAVNAVNGAVDYVGERSPVAGAALKTLPTALGLLSGGPGTNALVSAGMAAERRMAAANAQIGAAETAFFPVITLGASANYRNTDIQHLISLPNTLWSVGPNLAFNLFDGGLRASAVALAQANYDQTVANYRQTVLAAFEEVENNLATEAALTQEIQVQQQAIAAANTALRIAQSQYRAGTTSALNVISAQTTLWTAEKNAIDLWSRLLQSKINIIKSIGFSTNSK
jgi:outer membrane protein TolC